MNSRELFVDAGMLDEQRESIGGGRNTWRGLYPRVRSGGENSLQANDCAIKSNRHLFQALFD
jgi:hypothetical protein